MVLWIILAITSFIGAFFVTPIFMKIVGIIFGVENLLIILSLGISLIQERIKYKRLQKDFEKEETPGKE